MFLFLHFRSPIICQNKNLTKISYTVYLPGNGAFWVPGWHQGVSLVLQVWELIQVYNGGSVSNPCWVSISPSLEQ